MELTVLQFVKHDDRAKVPTLAHAGDNGFDLCCLEGFMLAPGERKIVQTGIGVALPHGWAGLVVPRSGLAAKHGISVVNAPGLIDFSFRGDIGVILLNTDHTYLLKTKPGDRIAQLVIVQTATPEWIEVDQLPDSERGVGAYGSSGL